MEWGAHQRMRVLVTRPITSLFIHQVAAPPTRIICNEMCQLLVFEIALDSSWKHDQGRARFAPLVRPVVSPKESHCLAMEALC